MKRSQSNFIIYENSKKKVLKTNLGHLKKICVYEINIPIFVLLPVSSLLTLFWRLYKFHLRSRAKLFEDFF